MCKPFTAIQWGCVSVTETRLKTCPLTRTISTARWNAVCIVLTEIATIWRGGTEQWNLKWAFVPFTSGADAQQ